MPTHFGGRREFLKTLAVVGAAARVRLLAAYNPAAKFELTVSEVEYRRTKAGRALMVDRYEALLQHRTRLPTGEYTTLRQVLLLQARAMARVMRGEQADYVGFVG